MVVILSCDCLCPSVNAQVTSRAGTGEGHQNSWTAITTFLLCLKPEIKKKHELTFLSSVSEQLLQLTLISWRRRKREKEQKSALYLEDILQHCWGALYINERSLPPALSFSSHCTLWCFSEVFTVVFALGAYGCCEEVLLHADEGWTWMLLVRDQRRETEGGPLKFSLPSIFIHMRMNIFQQI